MDANDTGHRLDELDLLAYADGLLDADPVRKARVEAALSDSPEQAARVGAWRAQTEALRRRYGPRITDPVPDRLYAALKRRPQRLHRTIAQAAAVVVLTVGAGTAGWMAGRSDPSQDGQAKAFVEQSYRNFAEDASNPSAEPVAHATPVRPMNWRSGDIALTIHAPDLSDKGFSILDQRTVQTADSRMVRTTYGAPDGRSFSLFLRPRWRDEGPGVRVTTQGDISLAYWLDGPLASAVASRLPPDETLALAKTVRRAMRGAGALGPIVVTPGVAASPRGAAMTTGALSDEVPTYPQRSTNTTGFPRKITTTN